MYNDADIEQAAFEAEGNRIAALHKQGICTHGYTQGYTPTHRPDLAPCKVECLDCGRVFANWDALEDARADVL